MPKWKVIAIRFHPSPLQERSSNGRWPKYWQPKIQSDYHKVGDPEKNIPPCNALIGYQIVSVGGVAWEDIPSAVKEENSSGWRFIKLADNITLEHFEIEEIEAN